MYKYQVLRSASFVYQDIGWVVQLNYVKNVILLIVLPVSPIMVQLALLVQLGFILTPRPNLVINAIQIVHNAQLQKVIVLLVIMDFTILQIHVVLVPASLIKVVYLALLLIV